MIKDVKILLTRRCNLDCNYCFAKNFRSNTSEPLDMSMELFHAIINTCLYNGIERVNLLGGEPTLHPHFQEILDYINKTQINTMILSNAINLEQYLPSISYNTTLLLNINSEKDIGTENYRKMLSTLDRLHYLGYMHSTAIRKATLGFNIYNKDPDTLENFYNICDRYQLPDARISICSPINLDVPKYEYYSELKDLVLEITAFAKDRGIQPKCDCSMVPPCYFTTKELLQLQEVWENYSTCCSPICAINTSGTVVPCFSNIHYDEMVNNKRNFLSFAAEVELREYINTSMMLNTIDACQDCPQQNSGCINGCGGTK